MITEKVIRVSCEGADLLPYTKILEYQGNLKELSKENYEKLKQSILKHGFAEPITAWNDKDKIRCANGHQRLRTVKNMVEQEGYKCPDLPVNWVHPKDEEDFARIVLSLASQFGQVTDDGLYQFAAEHNIDIQELNEMYRFPEIDMNAFGDSYFGEPTGESEEITGDVDFSKEIDEKNDYVVLVFDSKEDFKVACEKLNIQTVQYDLSPTKHEAFNRRGIGRILDGKSIISRL